jgi:CRP-like cAMP-binding protein
MLDVLDSLTPADANLLAPLCRRERHRAGDRLMVEGEPVSRLLVLREGTVRVERCAGVGVAAAVSRVRAHALLGERALLPTGRAAASVVADTDLVVDALDATALAGLVVASPRLGARIYRALATAIATRAAQLAPPH